jgi:hypothetical protein
MNDSAQQEKLIVTIDRIEGSNAVLSSQKDDDIVVPKNLLPQGTKIGDELTLSLCVGPDSTAKDILSEILNV